MIIRCISLWQPFASLMARGVKRFETRSWSTKIRGLVYIHAAATLKGVELVGAGPTWITNSMEDVLGPFEEWRETLPFGAIIGRGYLVDSMPAAVALQQDPEQEPFGDFTEGRFVHVYNDLRETEVTPCKGRQGFWSMPIEDGAEIALLPERGMDLDHELGLWEAGRDGSDLSDGKGVGL